MILSSLLSHVGYIRIRGSSETEVKSITCNSKEVSPGALFVCISGYRRNGHEFAAEAVLKGASVIVMEETDPVARKEEKNLAKEVSVVMVASSRTAFSCLATAFYRYPLRSMVSVAVTGTKGKTTTAYMVYEILKK